MRFSRTSTKHLVVLTLVAGAIFFFKLGDAPLWDRDEPRNAGCAAEMIAANDWVVPIFNAELRTHKPVLLYWLMMSAYSIFGVNEFGARFSSAVLGLATVLLTYGMGRRMFSASVGFWSGLILCSTIMFGVAARAATPDSLLIFCGTLAIALFVYFAFDRRYEDESSLGRFPTSIWQAALIYAAMGLGVLAKGPVGLVVPTAVIGMYLLIVRLNDGSATSPSASTQTIAQKLSGLFRPFAPIHFLQTCRAMRPMTAILVASLIAVPWYVWVAIRTNGAWTTEFFWTHNISRATQSMEGHSGPPILFYVGAILVGFFPWSILTIPTGLFMHKRMSAEGAQRDEVSDIERLRFSRSITLLLCWVGVYIGVFSLAQTKLPSYVTPCYPALALMAGVFVCEWRTSISFRQVWLKVGLGNLIAVGAILLVALPLAASRFLPGSEWVGVIGLVPLVGGIITWVMHRREEHSAATTSLAWTAAAFMVLLMGVLPAEIGRHRRYEQLFQLTANHEGPVATFGYLEPSWIFYGGRPLHDFQSADASEFVDFLRANPDAVVISTTSKLQELEQTLRQASGRPSGSDAAAFSYEVLHETEYFLRDRALLLVKARMKEGSFANPSLAERKDDKLRK